MPHINLSPITFIPKNPPTEQQIPTTPLRKPGSLQPISPPINPQNTQRIATMPKLPPPSDFLPSESPRSTDTPSTSTDSENPLQLLNTIDEHVRNNSFRTIDDVINYMRAHYAGPFFIDRNSKLFIPEPNQPTMGGGNKKVIRVIDKDYHQSVAAHMPEPEKILYNQFNYLTGKTSQATTIFLIDPNKPTPYKLTLLPYHGMSLSHYLEDYKTTLSIDDRHDIFQQIYKIKTDLNQSTTIYHGDIKPENFCIAVNADSRFTVSLIDFGSASDLAKGRGIYGNTRYGWYKTESPVFVSPPAAQKIKRMIENNPGNVLSELQDWHLSPPDQTPRKTLEDQSNWQFAVTLFEILFGINTFKKNILTPETVKNIPPLLHQPTVPDKTKTLWKIMATITTYDLTKLLKFIQKEAETTNSLESLINLDRLLYLFTTTNKHSQPPPRTKPTSIDTAQQQLRDRISSLRFTTHHRHVEPTPPPVASRPTRPASAAV